MLNFVRKSKKILGNYIMSNSDGEFKVLMNNFSDVGVCWSFHLVRRRHNWDWKHSSHNRWCNGSTKNLLWCDLATVPENKEGYKMLLQEGKELWERWNELALLKKEMYLLQEINDPGRQCTVDILLSWVKYITPATKECMEHMPKVKTTIFTWLKKVEEDS